jgi:hypothetical protein
MDWWVALLVGMVIVALGSGILMVLWWSGIPKIAGVVTALILAAAIVYIVDIAFYSFYALDDKGLSVMSHLRHAFFPYRDMRALQPGGVMALFSFSHKKRFALSRRNVIIKIVNSHWKTISVSPEARDEFIHTILERIDHERSARAAR